MALPEKEPHNESKKELKTEPKLDAILPTGKPEHIPPAAAELIDDIDSYQKKMETQWETAKSSYEKKINQIMEDFLKQNPTASLPPRETPPLPSDEPAISSHFEGLMSRVEKELSRYNRKRPSMINLTFRPELLDLSYRARKWILFALAGVVLGSAYFYSTFLTKVTALPYAHTLGPVLYDGKIYILDWFRKGLFVHERTWLGLPIRSVEFVPALSATGFALSNKNLFASDGVGKTISRHALTIDHELVATITAPGDKPMGLYFDGTDLWSGDPYTRTLYRHRGNELEDIRDEYVLPDDVTLTAFSLHTNRVWLLDGKSRILNVYRLQKPMKLLASFDLDSVLNGATPTGTVREGNKLLMVTENPSTLMEVPLSKLKNLATTLNSSDWRD